MEQLLRITAGVFIGGLLALLAHDAITEARIEHAARQALRQMQNTTDAALRRQAEITDRQRQQNRADESAQQEQRALQRQLAEDGRRAREAREKAFDRYFVPSPSCRADPASVDCGNAHIRARAQFDRDYRPGN